MAGRGFTHAPGGARDAERSDRALRAWGLVVCLACGPAGNPAIQAPLPASESPAPPAAPPPPESTANQGLSREPSSQERRLIQELVVETERFRGLRFKRTVEVRIQDRQAMRGYVSRAIDQEDLVRARRRYVALGLLDPKLDVRDLLESLMEEELVGYYDPKLRMLAVRDDVARALGRRASASDLEWRATVVHELVHALQDQHLGLAAAMEQERTTDADNAFGALVEGDATLAMLGYAAGKSGLQLDDVVRDRRQLQAILGASPERVTGALRAAPAIVREPLLFRYHAGALFAAALYQRAGWAEIDAAHARPPEHSLSIVDPARYPPPDGDSLGLPLLPLEWLEERGFRKLDEDVLGSLEIGVVLGSTSPGGQLAARAWRGDRYAVFAGPDGDASVWCMRFATREEAQRVARALGQLPDAEGLSRKLLREGPLVLLARNLPAPETEELLGRFRAWAKGNPLPTHAVDAAHPRVYTARP
jgi:hypothetical protein